MLNQIGTTGRKDSQPQTHPKDMSTSTKAKTSQSTGAKTQEPKKETKTKSESDKTKKTSGTADFPVITATNNHEPSNKIEQLFNEELAEMGYK